MDNPNFFELFGAFAKAKKKFKPLQKSGLVKGYASRDGKPGRPDRQYSTLADIVDSTHNALSEEGLAIMQFPKFDDGIAIMETMLAHESGQSIMSEFRWKMVLGQEQMTPVQQIGSIIKYMQRYTLYAFLLPPGDDGEDDDGESATLEPVKGKPMEKQNTKPAAERKASAPVQPEQVQGDKPPAELVAARNQFRDTAKSFGISIAALSPGQRLMWLNSLFPKDEGGQMVNRWASFAEVPAKAYEDAANIFSSYIGLVEKFDEETQPVMLAEPFIVEIYNRLGGKANTIHDIPFVGWKRIISAVKADIDNQGE